MRSREDLIWVRKGPSGMCESSHFSASCVRRRAAMRRDISRYLIEVGTMENSLESARWGVAIGRSKRDLAAENINAFVNFLTTIESCRFGKGM